MDFLSLIHIFKITLPYMLYVTTPYLIATFTGNVNNFNIIYLLSGGDPVVDLSSTAGSTDLLVTWPVSYTHLDVYKRQNYIQMLMKSGTGRN